MYAHFFFLKDKRDNSHNGRLIVRVAMSYSEDTSDKGLSLLVLVLVTRDP